MTKKRKAKYCTPEALEMPLLPASAILLASPTGEGYDEPEGYDAF